MGRITKVVAEFRVGGLGSECFIDPKSEKSCSVIVWCVTSVRSCAHNFVGDGACTRRLSCCSNFRSPLGPRPGTGTPVDPPVSLAWPYRCPGYCPGGVLAVARLGARQVSRLVSLWYSGVFFCSLTCFNTRYHGVSSPVFLTDGRVGGRASRRAADTLNSAYLFGLRGIGPWTRNMQNVGLVSMWGLGLVPGNFLD